MMPFIHIGPITLASYGLCVGMAMLISYFVLAKDMQRRAIHAPADLMVAVPCIAGLVGAKLYHVLETPRDLFADPRILISQYGFAWFGGFLGGFIAFVLLARHYRIPLLEIFDAASPAAALGYGIGRIGCLISGDGDYGIPTTLPWGMSFPNGIVPTTERVHPTPIYEFLAAILIAWILWRLGARALKTHVPNGLIFAAYLVLTGIARFLVEIIRINPRSFYGLKNEQAASVVSVIAGVALYLYCRKAKPVPAR